MLPEEHPMSTTTISVPFPAFSAIFDAEQILAVLRQEPLLEGIPSFRTPRRITTKDRQEAGEYDALVAVELWCQNGAYLNAEMAGTDDASYGTQWELLDLRVRFKNYKPTHREDTGHKVDLRIGGDDLAALRQVVWADNSLGYARDVGSDESIADAEQRLAEAQAAAAVTARRLAAQVAQVALHREVWRATKEAGEGSVAFCWLPGGKWGTASDQRWTWGRLAHWDPELGYVDHNDPRSPKPVEDMSW